MPGIKVYGGGVTAENGNYAARVDLDKLHGAILEALAQPSQAEVDFVALQTAGRAAKTYGPPSFVDPAVLSDAHWGIIWPEKPWTANEQAHYAALQELVAWRAAKNGVVPLEKEYRDRWNYAQFLQYAGPNVLPGQMDTEKIPYYLCIVASPERISWEFQQFLDGEYAVGRLWFDDPRDCVSYVRKLIAYEDETKAPGNARRALLVGPQHARDPATASSANELVAPLAGWLQDRRPTLNFEVDLLLDGLAGSEARFATLRERLVQPGAGSQPAPPALIFTAGHGVEYATPCAEQYEMQGALVLQGWEGGPILAATLGSSATTPGTLGLTSDQPCLCARHVGAALPSVAGSVILCFACYSAGTPLEQDWVQCKLSEQPATIALKPFVARLPQKLLADGALGFIGHVSRAWTYSIKGVTLRSGHIVHFKDVCNRLLTGQRLGHATDGLNAQWGECTKLLEMQKSAPATYTKEDLTRTWMARNDFRNYVLVGDPAARIRVDALA